MHHSQIQPDPKQTFTCREKTQDHEFEAHSKLQGHGITKIIRFLHSLGRISNS